MTLRSLRRLGFTLLLATLMILTGAPDPAQSQPDPLPLGFHLHHGDARHLAAARQAGGAFGVVVFSWADIEPTPGYFYWERPDSILRAAEFYNVEIIARLDRPPDWALDAESPSPWQPDAYGEFTRRVAERYGDRLTAVILWNEPNLALEWHNQPPNAANFVDLLRAGYIGVKAAAPDLPVLLGGPAMTFGDGITALNDLDFLRAVYAHGGGDFFDGLAAHPYGFGRPPQDDPAPDRLNFRRLELQQAILAENGDDDKPIWITESGWRVSAPDPADGWQVVSPPQQQAYTLEMIALAERYPWLRGIALWELNGDADLYGYNLWHGDDDPSPLYRALVDGCTQRRTDCTQNPADRPAEAQMIPVLAADVAIRLGDRGELHPHWVHLYQGGDDLSVYWQGEFFLSRSQANQPLDLLVETMQIDQPGNQIWINGHPLADLTPRSRPDATSTWVTQRHRITGERLRPGLNTIRISTGLRNPARQYGWWRYENFMFRHLRFVPIQQPQPIVDEWLPLPNPAGWSELTRFRAGEDDSLWIVGNRAGQIWRLDERAERVIHQAGNRPDLIFRDVVATGEATLAATTRGLFRLDPSSGKWSDLPEPSLRGRSIQTVMTSSLGYLAGVEGGGLWRSADLQGRWHLLALAGRTVFDVVEVERAGERTLFAATDQGIFARDPQRRTWTLRPLTLRPLTPFPADAPGKLGLPPEPFTTRLFAGDEGTLIARNQDRLWAWDGQSWSVFGPAEIQGRIVTLTGCCGAGTLLGTFGAGLWQQTDASAWRPIAPQFQRAELMDLAVHRGRVYAAGSFGLFVQSQTDADAWQPVDGLPPVLGDLLIDPQAPERWFAATPAGVYRSEDGGQIWSLASPPWTVFDLALDAKGRFWAATTGGLYFVDDLQADPLDWQATEGMDPVLFFRVNPHPSDPSLIWAGSWGNNVAASSDGGVNFAPIHNGLETLSALDILWHATPGQVTIGTIEGIYRSDDGGQRWFKLPGALDRQTVHALYQGEDGVIWAGAADGLWRSADYGVTWERAADVSPATIHRLGQIRGTDGERWLWAGSEYAGLWLSLDSGASWRFGGLEGRSVFHLLPHPQHSGQWIVATDRGIFTAPIP
jgi:ligand-binding sensor domain-containing protein